MKKKIIVTSCKKCPYNDLIFSKTGKRYCNRLSKLVLKEVLYSQIYELEKEFNTPKRGILKECPLRNN